MLFKPMLADPPEDEKHPLRFPFYMSPKLDGIRCIITPEGPRTRSLKEIPNRRLAEILSAPELIGLDGELIAGDANARDAMQETSKAVMGRDADSARVTFHVFDCVDDWNTPATPYSVRMLDARRAVERAAFGCVRFIEHTRADSWASVQGYMAPLMAAGFEGVMLRSPSGLYKFGRSTAKEQGLLKLKRFEDSEFVILDAFELEHNANEQTRDELGRAKRSSAKGGKVAADTLGGFVVALAHPWTAKTLRVGNGWTAPQRAELWAQWKRNPDALRGRWLKVKFQREGSKDAPRLPVAIGLRDPRDMGAPD